MISQATLAEIHASIPKHLYEKSTVKALYYVARDVFFAVLTYKIGTYIDPFSRYLLDQEFAPLTVQLVKWSLWTTYWWWQGVILAGWWCLGMP